MPHKLPDQISQHIKTLVPPTHKMWWIRGVILAYRVIPRHEDAQALYNESQDVLVSVGDLDAVGDGYDVRLEGVRHDLAEGDIVSLFGHEEVTATQVSQPRVLLMHGTGAFDKVFPSPATLEHSGITLGLDYRNWLAVKTKEGSSLRQMGKAALPRLLFGGMAGGVGIPSLTEKAARGLANKLGPKSLHDNQGATPKEKVMQDFADYKYQDITEAYKQLVQFISAWAVNNPDPEKGFVVVRRGGNTLGQLVE